MDFKALCNVNAAEIKDSAAKVETKEKVADSKKRQSRRMIKDSRYIRLKKKIKDDLMETESTDEVIEVVNQYLNEAPAEQVMPAVIEILGEAIDALEAHIGDSDDDTLPEPEVVEEEVEETVEDIEDSKKSDSEKKEDK